VAEIQEIDIVNIYCAFVGQILKKNIKTLFGVGIQNIWKLSVEVPE